MQENKQEPEPKVPMLLARCKRLAGRTKIVGHTVFKFNAMGICHARDVGTAASDFKALIRLNGIERITLDDIEMAPPNNGIKQVVTPSTRKAPEFPPDQKLRDFVKEAPIPEMPKRPVTRNLPPVPATTNTVNAEDVPGETTDNLLGGDPLSLESAVAVDLPETPLVSAEVVVKADVVIVDDETGEVVSAAPNSLEGKPLDSDEDTNPEAPAAKKSTKSSKPNRRRSTKKKKDD